MHACYEEKMMMSYACMYVRSGMQVCMHVMYAGTYASDACMYATYIYWSRAHATHDI